MKTLEWKAFTHGGETYDLSHLRPQTFRFERPAEGKNKAEAYDVDVRFTSHCFTRGPRPGETYDLSWIYPDFYEVRLFDLRRYEMSKRLADAIRALPARKPRHNKNRGNYFTMEMLTDEGMVVEYDIFFKVKKPRKGSLEMLIETALIRDPGYGSTRPDGKPVRFWIILHNTLHGRVIRT